MRTPSAVATASLLFSFARAAKPINVTIDPTPKQTLAAFGASGAWWPNDLILFPKAAQAKFAEFLFSEDGMHLSSYRYNMGGGGDHDETIVNSWEARVESFLLDNGTYDWSRDHAGVTFLKYAQQYQVPDITFFINAAPAAIATNHAACGWSLTMPKIPAFAKYINTVLSHWTQQGIDIKYISPMNEPDNNRSACTQEGMAVVPKLRSPFLSTLRNALNRGRTAQHVEIIADETSQITTQAFPEDPVWLPAAANNISHIAVHNYDYPSDASLQQYYSKIRALTSHETLPPVKFTETCCSTRSGTGSDVFGEQYDPSMTNALIVARYVWQFLTIVQAVSFDWWTAVTYMPCSPSVDGEQCATAVNNTAGYNSGLVGIDPNYNTTRDFGLYPTKRAFMLKHFAAFHRPGSVRYDVPQTQLPTSINVVASKSADGKQWSVLFMNHDATSAQTVSLQAPSKWARVIRAVQTTNATDFADVKPMPQVTKQGTVVVKMPAQSFVTLQFAV